MFKIQDMVLVAIFAAIITVCSYIQIPFGPIPFTMQNFAVFLAAGMLGLKRGTLTVITYILLGIIGLPVFRGLGGVGALMGPTGGFIIGFIFVAIIVGIAADKCKKNQDINRFIYLFVSMFIANMVCMAMGCIWYMYISKVSLGAAIAYCVLPFIVTDIVKMILATIVNLRIKLPRNVE